MQSRYSFQEKHKLGYYSLYWVNLDLYWPMLTILTRNLQPTQGCVWFSNIVLTLTKQNFDVFSFPFFFQSFGIFIAYIYNAEHNFYRVKSVIRLTKQNNDTVHIILFCVHIFFLSMSFRKADTIAQSSSSYLLNII